MKKVLVIVAHPDVSSFNHAIASQVKKTLENSGHQVMFHDLYEEKFDAILPTHEIPKGATLPRLVKQHSEEITKADGIIIIHPNWHGQPPAILKGWLDRAIRPGTAYEFIENGTAGEGYPTGLLKGMSAIVFNTSNTEESIELEQFGDPLEIIWKKCIFGLCGISDVHRKNYSVVIASTDEQRKAWLQDAATLVESVFP